MRTLYVIISAILFIGFMILLYLHFSIPDFKPIVTKTKIYSKINDETLYIKKKVWGVTGDHRVVIVSNSSKEDFEPSDEHEYIYRGLNPLFFGFRDDTLSLYVRKKSDTPKMFSSKIVIVQNVLDNAEMRTLNDIYQKKGLQKIK